MKDSKINRKYGWRPDLPDHRDVHYLKSISRLMITLPPKVDLRPGMPPVYEQMSLGSCTSNAIGAAHQFDQLKQGLKETFVPSRLFIYFNEREMEGTINEDAGAMIRDGIKSIADKGVCSETEWPYVIGQFTVRPPDACYAHAVRHQALTYQRLNVNLREMKNCLAEGYPFVFGFSVYENFEGDDVARTGMMPMPGGSQLGGHAVIAVGYDDSISRMIVRNSWGSKWGDLGYFYMPYNFISNSNLCDDFWTVRSVEADDQPVAVNKEGSI